MTLPDTRLKDDDLLRQALAEEPDKAAARLERILAAQPGNERCVFYLAQSYRDAGDLEAAITTYQRRVVMGGEAEDVWYSLYQIAVLKAQLGRDLSEVVIAFLEAYRCRPSRVEPLYRLGALFQDRGDYSLADLFLAKAIEIPPPPDRLFVEHAVYDHLAAIKYAAVAFYAGDDAEALRVNNLLLSRPDLSGEHFLQVLRNRRFSLDRRYPELPATGPTPRVVVLVHVIEAGPALDNCVEALAFQDSPFRAVFAGGAGATGFERQIPDDDRFVTLALSGEGTAAAALDAVVGDHCRPDDVMLWIDAPDWPADERTVGFIARYFHTHDCWALVGQHRFASGEYGLAMPFPDRASFEAPLRMAYHPVSRAFRVGLWRRVVAQGPDLGGSDPPQAIVDALLDVAGFERAHFSDEVLVVRDLDFVPEARVAAAGGRLRERLRPADDYR